MNETLLPGMSAPLAECDWVLWRKCGCPQGVCVASYAPTEDAAWAEFYDDWEHIAPALRRGEHLELMTHERYVREVSPRMRTRCDHEKAGANR